MRGFRRKCSCNFSSQPAMCNLTRVLSFIDSYQSLLSTLRSGLPKFGNPLQSFGFSKLKNRNKSCSCLGDSKTLARSRFPFFSYGNFSLHQKFLVTVYTLTIGWSIDVFVFFFYFCSIFAVKSTVFYWYFLIFLWARIKTRQNYNIWARTMTSLYCDDVIKKWPRQHIMTYFNVLQI